MIGYTPQQRPQITPQYVNTAPPAVFGLIFPSNTTAGSDIGLNWTGANLVPRLTHTVMWSAKFVQQAGYYAWCWHCWNDTTFHADTYELGCHPFPSAAGAVDGSGQCTDGTASSGTVHYFEMAGLVAHDYLCSPGNTNSQILVTGNTYWQAETSDVISGGTVVRNTFWPDLVGNPSVSIVQDQSLPLSSPTAQLFRHGTSPWRAGMGGGGAGTNDETPSGTFRFLKQWNVALSLANIQLERVNPYNTSVTTPGNLWYSNVSPTPTDISDKSGAGHDPAWANANRPTLFTGP